MPKIIFNIGFCPANANTVWSTDKKAEWLENRAFYTCNAGYNYFSYIGKDGKVNTQADEETPRAYDEETNGSRKGSYMEKTSGVFSEKGVLSNAQKKDLEEKLKNTKSIIWHGFISFDAENTPAMNTQKACIDFIRANMGAYLKETHLKRDNLEVFYALHSDTDNAHIHFCFFEKQPLRINSKGETCFTEKGTFGKKLGVEYRLKDGTVVEQGTERARRVNVYDDRARDNFLLNAELYLDEHKHELNKARDRSMDMIKSAKPDIATRMQYAELRTELANLGKKLPQEGRLAYNSANMQPYKTDVDRAVQKLVDTVPEMRAAYNGMQTEIFKRDTEMKRICREQELDYNLIGKPRVEAIRNDFAARLGNEVIKLAKTTGYDKFADKAFVTNDLARKIAAKRNRTRIARSIGSFAKNAEYFLRNTVDFTRLHIAERQIQEERERAYNANAAASGGRRASGQ